MDILTLNCGSSSVKYQLYDWDNKEVRARGIVERVTVGGSFISHYAKGRETVTIEHDCPNHRVAIDLIIRTLLDPKIGALTDINDIKAVGHRLVHGGEKIAKSIVVDDAALRIFRDVADLSPLHNPANIMGIEAAREVLPRVPHTVSLDTAWHQTMPAKAYIYALPYKWYREYGVRRYGFHGTSFLYVAKRAAVLLGKSPFDCNLICMHIGNGASANAVMNGCSYDTSMGMTPLEGLVMGTRAGDHDPAIDFYIMRKEGVAPDILEGTLNKMSGIRGITEKYTDRRDVMKARETDKLAAAGDRDRGVPDPKVHRLLLRRARPGRRDRVHRRRRRDEPCHPRGLPGRARRPRDPARCRAQPGGGDPQRGDDHLDGRLAGPDLRHPDRRGARDGRGRLRAHGRHLRRAHELHLQLPEPGVRQQGAGRGAQEGPGDETRAPRVPGDDP